MKNNLIYSVIASTILLYSCSPTADKKAKQEDTIAKTECYKAIYEKDSADLKIETLSTGKIKGEFLVNYADKPHNKGLINGEFKGDTLYVDYRFTTGTDTATYYTNPLAFLKKDGKLLMGVGQIETTLGRSYFVKGKPINYERGKFVFESIPCK
jgi:hypothetical protein